MNPTLTLMRREWLQHRLGWTLLVLLPLAVALLLAIFADWKFEADMDVPSGSLPLSLLAGASIFATTALVFVTLAATSLIILSGLPRRDHGDRSIEFWLSLPTGHAHSLAVPLLVHLLLVPAAALALGWLGGLLLSAALVTRLESLGAWLALPWLDLLAGTLALWLRVLAGLPLAVLWLLPLLLLVMLSTALFKRWGIVLLVVVLGLGSGALERLFGEPLLTAAAATLTRNAGLALFGAGGAGLRVHAETQPEAALQGLPGWALHDFAGALSALAQPALAAGLLFAAACFAGLVLWRQRAAVG